MTTICGAAETSAASALVLCAAVVLNGAQAADHGPASEDAARVEQLIKNREYEAAARLLAQVVDHDPQDAPGWFRLAYVLRKRGEFDRAIAAYRRFARLRPSSADPYYGIALALQAKGDKRAAARSFRRYVRMEGNPERRHWADRARRLARLLESESSVVERSPGTRERLEAGRRQSEVVESPSEIATPSGQVLVVQGAAMGGDRQLALRHKARGDELRASGQYDGAVVAYEAAVSADYTCTEAYTALADLLLLTRQYGDARRALRVALRDNPEYRLGWMYLGRALRGLQLYRRAIWAYVHYLRSCRASGAQVEADAQFELGTLYARAGETGHALDALRSYLKSERRSSRASSVARAKQLVAALGSTDAVGAAAAGEAIPGSEQMDLGQRLLAMERKRAHRARQLAAVPSGLVAISRPPDPGRAIPDDPSEHLRIQADTLARLGKCSDGLPLYLQASELDGRNTKAFDGMAYCAYVLRQLPTVISALRKAVVENVDYVDGWLHLARLQRLSGDHVAAVTSYRHYMRARPTDLDVQFELAQQLALAGATSAAQAEYRAYLAADGRQDPDAKMRQAAARKALDE